VNDDAIYDLVRESLKELATEARAADLMPATVRRMRRRTLSISIAAVSLVAALLYRHSGRRGSRRRHGRPGSLPSLTVTQSASVPTRHTAERQCPRPPGPSQPLPFRRSPNRRVEPGRSAVVTTPHRAGQWRCRRAPRPPRPCAPENGCRPRRCRARDHRSEARAADAGRPVGIMVATAFVVAIAAALRLLRLDQPRGKLFDEIYYATDAHNLLRHGVEWNDATNFAGYVVHPPLGKWLIALGEQVFGYDELGWRIPSAVAGILAVLISFGSAAGSSVPRYWAAGPGC